MSRTTTLTPYGVQLHFASTKREWATLRRKLDFLCKTPDSAGLTEWALWVPKGSGITTPHLAIYVDLAGHTDPLDLIETCAHEAAHGAGHVLDWIGHEYGGSDEPHAYLVGWLTRWLMDACA